MRIRNYKSLTTTRLRKDALRILQVGMEAIDTRSALRRTVKRSGTRLLIGKHSYDLQRYRRVFVIGIGKAAFDAGREIEKTLGSYLTDGIILDVKGGALRGMKSIVGTHPFPSMKNIRATEKIVDMLRSAGSRDLVIAIISGGGSSLLCYPYKIKLADLVRVTRALMLAGATIQELNTVRKHLSSIQGGQFVSIAFPATVAGLIFSDVPGDDLSMVASGPTVLDTTTVSDARRVLKKFNVLKTCGLSRVELRETPKDHALFRRVRNQMILCNIIALEAMEIEARSLGYMPTTLSTSLTGEAREVGAKLADLIKPGEVIIAGGETTVTVRGNGKGGRNQEVALGALETLKKDSLVLSVASDGIDNGLIAGAFVDDVVLRKVRKLGLDPVSYLEENNSAEFFKKVGAAIRTGVTGTNVSDLMLAISSQK